MGTLRTRAATIAILTLGVSVAIAETGGPIPSLTGAPGEGTCSDCHGDFAQNQAGSVELMNAPPHYRGGGTYTMRLRVSSENTMGMMDRAWGFQLTAIDASGAGVGTFTRIDGQGTKIVAGGGALSSRRYIEQDGAGTRNGIAMPAGWDFSWTAPPTGSGPVTFHMVALAANGDGSEGGDWVYRSSFVMDDSSTTAVPVSWGAVKGAYR